MLLQPISNWKETGKQYDNKDSLLVKGGIQSVGWDRRTLGFQSVRSSDTSIETKSMLQGCELFQAPLYRPDTLLLLGTASDFNPKQIVAK